MTEPQPTAEPRRRRTGVAFFVAIVVTLLVLASAERVVGWSNLARTAATVGPGSWAGFVLFMAGSYLARACRLWTLIRRIGRSTSLRSSATLFLIHNTLVTFLPARLGEAALPILAHRWAALDWRPVLGALAWWRLTDLTVVAALALALLALGATALAPLIALAALACTFPFVAFGLRHWVLRESVAQPKTAPRTPRVMKLVRRIAHGTPDTWLAVAADLGWATLSWGLKVAGLTIVMAALLRAGAPDWPRMAAAVLAADVGAALPLPSLGGIGPYEAGAFATLTASGVAVEPAFAAALLVHAALLGSVLAAGAVGLALRATNARSRSVGSSF